MSLMGRFRQFATSVSGRSGGLTVEGVGKVSSASKTGQPRCVLPATSMIAMWPTP
jgi:hypothetical protein